MVVYGRYIGSIYVMFDNEGNPKYNTYDNQFTTKPGKEIKNDICSIISKNLENIPLETRIYIRKKHEEHNLRFSCFKTLEANPDRYDKSLYIFQIYTKSITTIGSIEDRNNNLIPEVELARKNMVHEMLEYVDKRYR